MISPAHIQFMARYNSWQNDNLYSTAAKLPDSERRRERGAFFGSIHGTLNHILWGDQTWMHRFAGTPKPAAPSIPASTSMVEGWDALAEQRRAFDGVIIVWSKTVGQTWLDGDVTWFSGGSQRDMTKPAWILVTHLFNHQTHHRGQVHCMLTQAGVKPGNTDLPWMPE